MKEFPVRKRLNHEIPQFIRDSVHFFFITLCARHRGTKCLIEATVAQGLLNATRHYHERDLWGCLILLIMPDHVHTILFGQSVPSGTIQSFKRYTAREHSISWEEGFFEHRLRDHRQVDHKLRYILENPVRAELVTEPDDWPFKICFPGPYS